MGLDGSSHGGTAGAWMGLGDGSWEMALGRWLFEDGSWEKSMLALAVYVDIGLWSEGQPCRLVSKWRKKADQGAGGENGKQETGAVVVLMRVCRKRSGRHYWMCSSKGEG